MLHAERTVSAGIQSGNLTIYDQIAAENNLSRYLHATEFVVNEASVIAAAAHEVQMQAKFVYRRT